MEEKKDVWVVVEGAIGAGKSCLIESLPNFLDGMRVEKLLEPIEVWDYKSFSNSACKNSIFENYLGNPTLNSFYFQNLVLNMAFLQEAEIMTARFRELKRYEYMGLKNVPNNIYVKERHLASALKVFIPCQRRMSTSVEERMLTEIATEYVSKVNIPDLIIYIDTDPTTCDSRQKQRNRPGEEYSLEYLVCVEEKYKEHMSNWARYGVPVFRLDGQDSRENLARKAEKIIRDFGSYPILEKFTTANSDIADYFNDSREKDQNCHPSPIIDCSTPIIDHPTPLIYIPEGEKYEESCGVKQKVYTENYGHTLINSEDLLLLKRSSKMDMKKKKQWDVYKKDYLTRKVEKLQERGTMMCERECDKLKRMCEMEDLQEKVRNLMIKDKREKRIDEEYYVEDLEEKVRAFRDDEIFYSDDEPLDEKESETERVKENKETKRENTKTCEKEEDRKLENIHVSVVAPTGTDDMIAERIKQHFHDKGWNTIAGSSDQIQIICDPEVMRELPQFTEKLREMVRKANEKRQGQSEKK